MSQGLRSPSVVGVANAVPAFLIWGLSPIFFKLLGAATPLEILMHRIVWSFLFLLPLILFLGRWDDFIKAITTGRTLGILVATTFLASSNWFIYIWAIYTNQILQASLGYYINPTINLFLGMIFLKERLRRAQWIAACLAGAGVAYLTFQFGELPWISLGLALTFGLYGLIRKVAPVGAMVGLTVETMLMFLPALMYLLLLHTDGSGVFFQMGFQLDALLMSTALVTTVPLLLFTNGARKIHLSTIGILQYIAPSVTFLLAVFVYGEPFEKVQLRAFICIWAAFCIYSVDSILYYRKNNHSHLGKIKKRQRCKVIKKSLLSCLFG